MRKISFLILSATALLLATCGKKGGKTGLLVPKDAMLVVHINSSSLSSKLSWDEIKQTDWYKKMAQENEDSLAKQVMADPETSGIDSKSDFVFYMKKQSRGGLVVFEGSIKDASKFESFLKEVRKKNGEEAPETKTDGDFKYIASSREGLVLWNSSMFAFVASSPMPGIGRAWGGMETEGHEFPIDSLVAFGKGALTLKPDANLDGDSRFADLVKDGRDVHLWTNAEAYMGDMSPMMSMMKFNVLFEGNVSATSFSFENGKISATSKGYYNDEMRKLLEKYKPSNVSADLINRIPGNVSAVMAFNYPPNGIMAFLQTIGADGMVNGFLSKINYSIEEFVKAVKGDVLVSVSDLAMVEKKDTINYGNGMEPYVYTSTKPDVKVLFATSVNDKAAFEKLITLAWEATKGKTEEFPSISYKVENNWFAASNSPEQTNGFLTGSTANNQPFASKIAGHPFAMYIDLQKIIRSLWEPNAKGEEEKQGLALTMNMWQDVVVTGGEYKDKAVVFDFDVNLVDKNTNSLKQLNQYISKMTMLNKQRFAEREMNATDTVGASEPAPLTK